VAANALFLCVIAAACPLDVKQQRLHFRGDLGGSEFGCYGTCSTIGTRLPSSWTSLRCSCTPISSAA
jgi:hypothetical protein